MSAFIGFLVHQLTTQYRKKGMAEIDPTKLSIKERYRLLVEVITPRPIGLISTMSSNGKHNVAPYSFFNGVGSNPMTVLFCPVTNSDGSDKDSMRNALPREQGGRGEFVANVVVEGIEKQVAAASEPLAFGESEFELAGFTPLPSTKISAPRVAESPIHFECKTIHVVRTHAGLAGSGNVVIGQVVYVHVADDLLDAAGQIISRNIKTIGRMGGPDYVRTGDVFSLMRGKTALAPPASGSGPKKS